MRVIFVDRAGAQSIWGLMAAIAKRLLREGHQPVFCLFDDGRSSYIQSVPDGVERAVIPVPRKQFLWDLYTQHQVFGRAFRDLLRRIRPDVVHTNFCVPGIAARWISVHENVPAVVSTQHELYGSMYPHYRWGLRLTERCADAVVYVSQTAAKSFGRQGLLNDIGKTRQRVIPNGVDVGVIREVSSAADRRTPGKLVCVARMVRLKGQETLIRALQQVIAVHPQAHLTLVGTGPDKSWLRRLVRNLRLLDHVRFAGWLSREDTLREMATAQAVVVPSTQEGFGLVLVEAMLCGTPVVASDIPVFREVADGGSGAVSWFPPGNAEALARELISVLDRQAGPEIYTVPERPDIERRYSLERMSTAYVELYADLLRQKPVQKG
ncbi:glycosyltransferase family 4 protein [Methylocaldum sp. RMAD-M]|jgi:glycosyltransferase involved in cell wall biosynthesis|uniref:glycosyltransferase family 4 protein n=1 Tax=Methylocaldum sp. RMAD-M TaxID=2806557 RepID=UPI000A323FC6|nr:glycosyltransferase family 4 protein [Methylocaldum sp. RMAD-M]MBP1152819.1 glycosyltransferase involved in cell wall biosynthesis [Methylocaldum sp. RMAD-M]